MRVLVTGATGDGSPPASIDLPTLWAYNITNARDGELTTMFWGNEPLEPNYTDPYPEDI